MARKQNQKRRLFKLGVEAANAIGIATDRYFCPLCGESFGAESFTDGSLTVEHVPPKSDGGKPIILTCKSCNNFSGHNFEFDLKNRLAMRHQIEGLVGGKNGDLGKISLQIGDVTVRAWFSREGKTNNLKITTNNDPRELERCKNELERLSEGSSIQFTSGYEFNKKNILRADLKACFLILTAKFGYTYAFSPASMPIRQAIFGHCPPDELIRYLHETDELGQLICIDDTLRCAAIPISDRLVLVPFFSSHFRFEIESTDRMKLSGKTYAMPLQFEAEVDRRSGRSND